LCKRVAIGIYGAILRKIKALGMSGQQRPS
jgi:hypothetical protein